MASRYMTANELEEQSGTPASTFRYWASLDPPQGPPSTKIGRRRVWNRAAAEKWFAERESASA